MTTDYALFHDLDRRQAEDDAYDEREEAIAERAEAIAALRLLDIDACQLAASELYGDPVDDLIQEAGKFFARYEAAQTDADMAQAGYALWRAFKPYMQAAALDEAQWLARKEIEAEDAGNRQDAADHAADARADR